MTSRDALSRRGSLLKALRLLGHVGLSGAALSIFVFIPFVPAALRALDFTAFYCAGEALNQHGDPYLALPLGSCEHQVAHGSFFRSAIVLPAPLPPYALAIMMIAARIPFSLAQHVLDVVSVVALVVAALLLGAQTRSGTLIALFALGPIAWSVLLLGQPIIVLVAALAACAGLLARQRDAEAAVCASIMMFEPHIGLPTCAALFLWRPRTRPAFLITAAAVVIVCLVFVPFRLTVEYFSVVLPLHARSEATSPLQYSSTSLLLALGVPLTLSLRLASVQYLLTVALGTYVARRVYAKSLDPTALAFVPSLFAVVGGAFIHYTDFLFAVPAGLLLLRYRPKSRIVAIAIIALNPPLYAIWGFPGALVGALFAAIMLALLGEIPLAFVCFIALIAMSHVARALPGPERIPAEFVLGSGYAEDSWTNYMQSIQTSALDLIRRAPEWIGLALLCSSSIALGAKHGTRSLLPHSTAAKIL